MRTWVGRAVVLAVALLAAAGMWAAAGAGREPTSPQAQTRLIASTLRCPTCAGEDVADSAAPLAEAMRAVISQQLAEGRSPAEVRDWFAERYGPEVLLDPPREGLGWLLWVIPVVTAATAAALLAPASSRARRAAAGFAGAAALGLCFGAAVSHSNDPVSVTPQAAAPVDVVDLLEAAAAGSPGDAAVRVALGRALDERGRTDEAVEQYAAATRLAPFDPTPAYLQAFALVRSGRGAQAVPVLERTLEVRPEHVPSLLLLGTVLWEDGDARGQGLLRDFLATAPDHAAAGQVRQMLRETGP